ncbi:MAG: DUF86 domain-containing protein [Promethearchaeota archaeon]|nr:MAG: DUF86 domain-containing protein [Candidatus Lokiarchaeota archaeon]
MTPISDLRYTRYREKINYIWQKLQSIPLSPKSELEKDGLLYGVQTVIEAAVDTIAMLVKDLGRDVKDDQTNLAQLQELNVISSSLVEFFLNANGMRNILVHRYNGVNEEIIIEAIPTIIKNLNIWLDILEENLNELYPPDSKKA